MSLPISNESDLVVYLGKYEKSRAGGLDFYPCVGRMSRNIGVTPDIDLLCIDTINDKTIGYEVKLVKYREGWNRYLYESIYRGIGQALLYNLYGIDRTYLVIGFFLDEVMREPRIRLQTKLTQVHDSLIKMNLHDKIGLKMIFFHDENVHLINAIDLPYETPFLRGRDFNYYKTSIIRREISWNNSMKEKIDDQEIPFKRPVQLPITWLTNNT